MSKPKLIVIAGPTAVGKTALAIQLAKKYNTEIISADSRQFYKEMTIGTAKPTSRELSEVVHHFINSHTVTDPVNAGRYERECLTLLETLFKKNRLLIMTGGSGLFIDAVCNGLDVLPPENKVLRDKLNEKLHAEGLEVLVEELKTLDLAYYKEADLKNPHRVIRALEVCMETGKPYSKQRSSKAKTRFFEPIKICLHLERDVLYERINQRVDHMVQNGLVEEARALLQFKDLNSLKTVGYREMFEYLKCQYDFDHCKALIKQNTRRYAKRQLTWFKRDKQYKWFSPFDVENICLYLETNFQIQPN